MCTEYSHPLELISTISYTVVVLMHPPSEECKRNVALTLNIIDTTYTAVIYRLLCYWTGAWSQLPSQALLRMHGYRDDCYSKFSGTLRAGTVNSQAC